MPFLRQTPFARTFHPDEANQAFAVGRLLETGRYEYRPDDHHGPTLYYAAVALQKAAGRDTTAALDGTLLRCTPLLFAVLALVLAFAAVRRRTASRRAAALAVLLLGTAPAFVFFATDFIQEMLLACFSVALFWAGAGYRAARTAPASGDHRRLKPGTWALLAGIAAGLAFATKETAVLTFAAATLAGAPFLRAARAGKTFVPRDLTLAAAGFALTSILFFSSFCTHGRGVYDAFVSAPAAYAVRALGGAASAGAAAHVHPIGQYLSWLFGCDGRFSALPLALLFAVTFRRRSFLHLYTLALLGLYSLLPYKTPWCALQIIVPMALAPFTMSPFPHFHISKFPHSPTSTFTHFHRTIPALPSLLALVALACHLAGDVALFRAPDARTIPYNYAAASPEVKDLAAAAAAALDASDSFLAVALPPEDTWPFPWYNRPHESRTGYWTSFAALEQLAADGRKPAAVIVPAAQGHLVQPLFPHLKHTSRHFMRPGVRVRLFW